MEITVKIDLSKFSDDELRAFWHEGIISLKEYMNELEHRRSDQ